MKLLVLALCIGSLPAFGQDHAQITVEQQRAIIERQRAIMERMYATLIPQLQTEMVSRAILQRQPFWLQDSSLGPIVVTATAVTADEQAHTLTLAGVEFKSSIVALSADEAIYDFRTGRIEPRGNVRLKPIQ